MIEDSWNQWRGVWNGYWDCLGFCRSNCTSQVESSQGNFYFYSPISQITNLPQGAFQVLTPLYPYTISSDKEKKQPLMGKKCMKPQDDWERKGFSSRADRRAANWKLFRAPLAPEVKVWITFLTTLHDSQLEHFYCRVSLKDAVMGRWVTPLDNIWYFNENKSKVEDCSWKLCGVL